MIVGYHPSLKFSEKYFKFAKCMSKHTGKRVPVVRSRLEDIKHDDYIFYAGDFSSPPPRTMIIDVISWSDILRVLEKHENIIGCVDYFEIHSCALDTTSNCALFGFKEIAEKFNKNIWCAGKRHSRFIFAEKITLPQAIMKYLEEYENLICPPTDIVEIIL